MNIDESKIPKRMPHFVKGCPNCTLQPTYTEGLNSVELPELFINGSAFGYMTNNGGIHNGDVINLIVACLYMDDAIRQKVKDRKETVELSLPNYDLTMCIAPVENTFAGALSAYPDGLTNSSRYVSITYVKGDEKVLDEHYWASSLNRIMAEIVTH